MIDEINSPGRTTNYLSEFWLADSFFSHTMWVHGKTDLYYKKIDFHRLYLFRQLYLYETFAEIKDNLLLYLGDKGIKKCIFDSFCQFVKNSSSLFYFTALHLRIMPDLVQEVADLESKFCPVCESCSIAIHSNIHSPGRQTVSQQRHGLAYQINLLLVAGRKILQNTTCHFCLILVLIFKKSVNNLVKELC